ncbi:hypothetical protein [Bernardetia sp.]|uniref:hypothetical protein n=1 Tax=Bernardetia sp. TaxID=1937974 RepID=UPI0025BA570A|nr:hypothetical protein [Bernardetia sp.]
MKLKSKNDTILKIMKLSYLILYNFFLIFFIFSLSSCEKVEDEVESDSFIGKWNYTWLDVVTYQNDTLVSEFTLPVQPSSFIEFRENNTYTSELLLQNSIPIFSTGNWQFNEQTNTIRLDGRVEGTEDWEILLLNKNNFQVLYTDIIEGGADSDLVLKLETTYTFKR